MINPFVAGSATLITLLGFPQGGLKIVTLVSATPITLRAILKIETLISTTPITLQGSSRGCQTS